MCGINGAFGLEDLENPEDIVRRMNLNLAHRGPDADGIYADNAVVLGHRRLSIMSCTITLSLKINLTTHLKPQVTWKLSLRRT
jgi:glutamine phosphoribosylpyrophosphate amidotransferase